ncbi:MAG TPA: hypothetical protein ENK49_04675 [Gammaproteobacteria bacterium]|nr:hypothetical protein [Gammaproteobacteria bacterium]
MNIITHAGAEAVTTDGLHWDIYVRDPELVSDIADHIPVQTSEIRYGSWSQQAGLKRGAIYPSEDFRILEQYGAQVYAYLLQHHTDVPFPLRDTTELWLLDQQGRPLGLLNSTTENSLLELDCFIDWRAGQDCHRNFRSSSAETLTGLTGTDCQAGQYLTQLVNERAGPQPAAQWFRRCPDGSGIGLQGIHLQDELENRTLPAGDFPRYFLREDGWSASQQQLVRDFLAWLAPCQLLLQDLDRPARQRFEQLAATRALEVDRHFRLYPQVLDRDTIQAARVEAALRRDETQTEREDETMATYYIELNVTRTN